jgi:hypothetical protein
MTKGPLDLVVEIAGILDGLGVQYALGGSMASSLLGEPRSTVDVDLAVRLDETTGDALLDRVAPNFYVPFDDARAAIRAHTAFNLLDNASALKVDLFVLGDGLLDRMQIERRVLVAVPRAPDGLWVTAAEDQVLRKLEWRRAGGSLSDRQWRDVVGILQARFESIDLEYLQQTAEMLGLSDDLAAAVEQADPERR